MADRLEDEEIATRLADLPGWERPDGTNAIRTTVKLADFGAALRFVNAVGELAEAAQHHPDIDIRWNKVTLVLSTHSAGGLTQLDFDLARQIDGVVA